MSLVVPAVLPASEHELDNGIALFTALPLISRIQIDVVDGDFASPPSWPYTAPSEMRKRVARGETLPQIDRIEYEIDLMCFDAEYAAEAWLALGATRLTFHAESTTSLPRLIRGARKRYGHIVTFGLALNIASDIALIEPALDEISYVQFMGIEKIGRQGQPFDARVLDKIRSFHSRHKTLPIQVDGGVSLDSAKKLVALGVSHLVIGSGILRSSDPAGAVEVFEALQNPYGA